MQFCLKVSALDPIEALKNSHSLTFRFDTSLGIFDEAYVDRLELRAATRALLNLQSNGTPTAVPDPVGIVNASGITDQLNQIRVSVYSLKLELYGNNGHAVHALLANETETASERLKNCTDASNGTFTDGWVTMEVTSPLVHTLDIFTLPSMFNIHDDMPPAEATKFTKDFFFPVHPEHYQLITEGGIGITETWGGMPTSAYLDPLAIPPPFVLKEVDLSYQVGVVTRSYLGDANKTTVAWSLQQNRQTGYGLEFNMRVWYPSACPVAYVHDQVEHLCVEYRNGLHLLLAYFGL